MSDNLEAKKAGDEDVSIEEILASIKEIITDDEDDDEGDVFELTERIDAPDLTADEEDDEMTTAEDEVVLQEQDDIMEVDMRDGEEDDTMSVTEEVTENVLSEQAATAALQGFKKLAGDMALSRESAKPSANGVTLEDIVRQMLQPMLREWLDENLPEIIEKTVQKELQKISSRVE